MAQAETQDGCLGKGMAIGGIAVSVFWLLNFTLGIFEIPDNLPFVGNIDEAVAAGVFFASMRYLGIDLLPFGNRRRTVPKAEVVEEETGNDPDED